MENKQDWRENICKLCGVCSEPTGEYNPDDDCKYIKVCAAEIAAAVAKEREAWNRTLMYLASLFGGGYSKDDIVPQILRLKKQSIMANKYRRKNKEQKIQITNLLRKLKTYEEGK